MVVQIPEKIETLAKERDTQIKEKTIKKYGLDQPSLEPLCDYICAVYGAENILTLLQYPPSKIKPLNFQKLKSLFLENSQTFVTMVNKEIVLTVIGENYFDVLRTFLPSWISVKFEKSIKVSFNWYKFTRSYFQDQPAKKFPLWSPGISYQNGQGAWRVNTKDQIADEFHQNVVDTLVSWGVEDDKVMNKALRSTADLIKPTIYDKRYNRPDQLMESNKSMLVAFRNGTYNFSTGEVQPHSKTDYLLNIHDYNVDFTADKAPETDRLLTGMMGADAKFFKEFIGYCFYPDHSIFQDFIFLFGEGGEGKSTLVRYIRDYLFGENNCSSLDIQTLTDGTDKFASSELYNMELNAVPDITSKTIEDVAVLKQILGADYISVQKKFGDRFEIKSRAKNIWSANHLPNIKGKDVNRALVDRVNIIKLINGNTREATNDFWKIHNMEKVRKELPQFVGECLNLFQQVLQRHADGKGKDSWSKTEALKALSKKWVTENDPVKQWLLSVKEENASLFEGGIFVKDDAYNDYRIWCSSEGINYPLSKKELAKELTSKYGFKDGRPQLPDGSRPHCWVNHQLEKEWNEEQVNWNNKR